MGSVGVAKLVAWGFVVAMLLVVACTSAEEEPAETGAVPAAAPPLQPPVAETATVTPTQAPPPPTALPTAASPTLETPGGFSRLVNEEVGYSLVYPSEWSVRGPAMTTRFGFDWQCERVQVSDFSPPPGSGIPADLKSFVQICTTPLTDGLTLDDFMTQTYSDEFLANFQITEFSGIRAYQFSNDTPSPTFFGHNTRIFLQTSEFRFHITTAITTFLEKRDERLSQVQGILDSFQLIE